MKTTLFTMLGYPGSGKSYFARQLAEKIKTVRLNNDGMRSSIFENPTEHVNLHNYSVVYGAIDYAAHEILRAGYSVIYDANVNHVSERNKNAQIAAEHGADAIVVWVKTSPEQAMQRVGTRDETADQFRVTEETVAKHMQMLEEPAEDEKYVVIDGSLPFEEQYDSFEQQLSGIAGL